jgi:hypothetical protein
MNKDMKLDVESLGVFRQQAHPNGTPRYYENENKEDIIGIAGEIAFAERYGLKPDLEIRPLGDGHVDFEIESNGKKILTIDVKTARKPYNLLIKKLEMERAADIFVLAKYSEEGKVDFLGWTTKEIMKGQPIKVFSSLGIENYYLHVSGLKKMELLDEYFKNNDIRQIINGL